MPIAVLSLLRKRIQSKGPSLPRSYPASTVLRHFPTPAPADAPTQPGAERKLGAVTELVFYDVNPAVKVTEVEPGSPAEEAGVLEGDVVLQLAGEPTRCADELHQLLNRLPVDVPLSLIMLRGERCLERLVLTSAFPRAARRRA